MDASRQTPTSLHVARILTLVVAIAGVAWIVITTQRRANRALLERQSADDETGLPEMAAFDPAEEFPELGPIDTEIRLPDAPEWDVDLPFVEPPRVELSFSESWPALPDVVLGLAIEPPFVMDAVLPPFSGDPYIGSSKSAVFTPMSSQQSRRNKRHGKP